MEKISVFEIFKIGVGPSSSHTIGPWRAAESFLNRLTEAGHLITDITDIKVELFGSLAKTGKGHGTDLACVLGLMGENIETVDVDTVIPSFEKVMETGEITLPGNHTLPFLKNAQLIFNFEVTQDYHANALEFTATLANGETFSHMYYSIGGGFIQRHGSDEQQADSKADIPFPVNYAEDLLKWSTQEKRSFAEISMINELHWRSHSEIRHGLDRFWQVMKEAVYRGCHTEGILPGGLNVQRRAAHIHSQLIEDTRYCCIDEWLEQIREQPKDIMNVTAWVSCFALAVNEVNASYGRIVTAPTNGAAGVIPAVLMYYYCFNDNITQTDIENFLLVAGEIGCIFKKNATISAAAGGCQAEVGVSSAMAAGALTYVLGGNMNQCLQAAEMAMEHHLGLTCDPIGGLVQIPCIERNSMGAMKAITAANLALHSDASKARVSLDDVVKTMWETAQDMNSKYKETAEGGLATNASLPEC